MKDLRREPKRSILSLKGPIKIFGQYLQLEIQDFGWTFLAVSGWAIITYKCVPVFAARQMGFEDASEVPELCRLAHDYLRKTKGCEESIYEYLAKENDPDSLYRKLIDEYERCILSYFAFHWNQASDVISQVHYPSIRMIF